MTNGNIDRRNIEKVLECVEERNKKHGLNQADAFGSITDCADKEFPDMTPQEHNDLIRAAESWMQDDFMEPTAVLESSEQGRMVVTRYTSPMGFRTEWVSTDPWRGHYSMKIPKGWTKLKSDTILSMHPSERDLKDLHDLLTEELSAAGVEWVVAFPRTSNVFATGYDMYVKKSQKSRAEKVLEEVEAMIRGGGR